MCVGSYLVAKMMPLCIWVGGSQYYYSGGSMYAGSMKLASNRVRRVAKMRPLSNMRLGGYSGIASVPTSGILFAPRALPEVDNGRPCVGCTRQQRRCFVVPSRLTVDKRFVFK